MNSPLLSRIAFVSKLSLRGNLRRTVICLVLLFSKSTQALPIFEVHIKDHLFSPAELHIPANQKVKITFVNHDNTPEEIDSFDLNREKVVFGNGRASIFVGPLSPGQYHFFGEYHPNSATGTVIVTETQVNKTQEQANGH